MKPKLTEEQFRRIPEFRKSLETFLDSPAGEAVQEILRSFAEPTAALIAECGSIDAAYMTANGRLFALRKLQLLSVMPADERKKTTLNEIIDREIPPLPERAESFTVTLKP
jgi:hypothetical protein